VNAISAGPVKTASARAVKDFSKMLDGVAAHSPLRRNVSLDDIGGSALYLLSDLSRGVTGEVHYVDAGYNIVSMPRPEVLKVQEAAGVMGEQAGA